MGDKSPKSKAKGQKQKHDDAAAAAKKAQELRDSKGKNNKEIKK